MSFIDIFKDPKVLGAIITALLAVAGFSGVSAVDANAQRDAALERSREEIRRDIDWGYNLCRDKWIQRKDAGEAERVPPVPDKKIERLANEAAQGATENK